jgi:hypothetical protein
MKTSGPYILIKDFREELDFFEAIVLFVDIDDLQFHILGNSGKKFSRIRCEQIKKFEMSELGYYENKKSKKSIFRYSETPKSGDILKSTYNLNNGERYVTLEKEHNITLDDFFKQAIYKYIGDIESTRHLKIMQLQRNYIELYKILEYGSIKTRFQS